MITNCELPNTLLNYNMELNDYDFVLFHLLRDNSEYREYYYNMRRTHPERLMILDNSAYEFFVKDEELDLDEFKYYIEDLQPDYYILPDKLMDHDKTIEMVDKFIKTYNIESKNIFNPKPLAVAQGNNCEELIDCLLKYKSLNIDYVGIPFHLSFYKTYNILDEVSHEFLTTYEECNEDLLYAMGRVSWIKGHKHILSLFDKVHLLGSHCPLEKLFYKDLYSMDTGYPVKLGIVETKLFEEKQKPNVIIDEFLDKELNENQISLIKENINIFKNI
jgi:hypothetical protein